jgi:hypothetical protein
VVKGTRLSSNNLDGPDPIEPFFVPLDEETIERAKRGNIPNDPRK